MSAFDGHPARTSESTWIELLHNGLTFDLKGLEPGQADEIPAIEHRFDLASERSAEDFETLRIVPGEHLISGKASMPIVKGMIGLARDMINHFEDLEGVYWPPSQSVIGRRFFESISTAWLEGGAFPALGLTAFKEAEDGALQSVGLDFWVGQELSIEPPLANDKVSATRLAVRIINQVILVGGISEAERITSPDRAVLIMKPSRNQKFIRVCPE
ncbi:MAG: hypothetical protein AAGL10_01590 [Pseudomonadota bacterium]